MDGFLGPNGKMISTIILYVVILIYLGFSIFYLRNKLREEKQEKQEYMEEMHPELNYPPES